MESLRRASHRGMVCSQAADGSLSISSRCYDRSMRKLVLVTIAAAGVCGASSKESGAQQPPAIELAAVEAIHPPASPLPPEAKSAGVTRFSFIAYGDTRGERD